MSPTYNSVAESDPKRPPTGDGTMETTETKNGNTTIKRVRGGTWMETKLGVTIVLSKDDCRALGFSESITSAEVARQVRNTIGLPTRERKAKEAPQKAAKRKTDAHIEREDIKGDKPIFHVFYAADTKSEQFGSRKAAELFIKHLELEAAQ